MGLPDSLGQNVRTFQKELPATEYEPIRYGLTKPWKSMIHSPLFHEWKSLRNDLGKKGDWKERLRYLYKPPGWSHSKSKLTSDEMRALSRKRELN
jgi:hypothetical protein